MQITGTTDSSPKQHEHGTTSKEPIETLQPAVHSKGTLPFMN